MSDSGPPLSVPLLPSPSHSGDSGDMGAGAMRPRHAVVTHSEAPARWLVTHARPPTCPLLARLLPSPLSPSLSVAAVTPWPSPVPRRR